MAWIGMEDYPRLAAVDHRPHALRLHEHGVECQLAESCPSISTADNSPAVALAGAMEDPIAAGGGNPTVGRLCKPHLPLAPNAQRLCGGARVACEAVRLASVVAVPPLLAAIDMPREDQTIGMVLVGG